MRAHVALRQIGQGDRGRGNRILALLDAVDNTGRLLARLVGGKFAVLAKRHSLRAARPPALHDVYLPPGGIDPHSEARQVMIPEDGVLALNREQIDSTFGNRQIVSFGHGYLARLICVSKSVIISTSTDIKSGRIGAHTRRDVNGHKEAYIDHNQLKTSH